MAHGKGRLQLSRATACSVAMAQIELTACVAASERSHVSPRRSCTCPSISGPVPFESRRSAAPSRGPHERDRCARETTESPRGHRL